MSAHSPPYALQAGIAPWSHHVQHMAERHGLEESLMARLIHEAMVVQNLYRNRGLAGIFRATLCRLVAIAKTYRQTRGEVHGKSQ